MTDFIKLRIEKVNKKQQMEMQEFTEIYFINFKISKNKLIHRKQFKFNFPCQYLFITGFGSAENVYNIC